MAKVIKIDPVAPSLKKIREAAKVIRNKGLVVYPTETCYGLGADATDPEAIDKVYEAKNRPKTKPIHVIVYGLEQLEKYGVVNKTVKKVAERFLPGPLSLIIKKKRTVPDTLSKDLCFRIPSHPVPVGIAYEANLPITATSANLSGKGPYYQIDQIKKELGKRVDLILDAGKLEPLPPSTIVDLVNKKIIREGPIPGRAVLGLLK